MRVIARLNVGGPSIHAILLSHSLNGKGYEEILVCGKVSESEGDTEALEDPLPQAMEEVSEEQQS